MPEICEGCESNCAFCPIFELAIDDKYAKPDDIPKVTQQPDEDLISVANIKSMGFNNAEDVIKAYPDQAWKVLKKFHDNSKQLKAALVSCLQVLNAIPNQPYGGAYKDTYALASALDKLLKE